MNIDRVVIVQKQSRLEELIAQHLTEGAAKFVLESMGECIDVYKKEDAIYQKALSEVQHQIPSDLQFTFVTRDHLPHFLFRDKDLIVVCGPDGLFANVAKYVKNQLILTVNPDPTTVAGMLMLFPPSAVREVITQVQKDTHNVECLPFVKASISGNDTTVWGINDIFIGRKDQVSARYKISFNGKTEQQSSSGIIVSTGIGSTGWIRSIDAMVSGLMYKTQAHQLTHLPNVTSNELVFVVREPFPSPNTGISIVSGRVFPDRELTIRSGMPSGGCVFSDGVVEDAVEWSAGSVVEVSVGDRYVQRIVPC